MRIFLIEYLKIINKIKNMKTKTIKKSTSKKVVKTKKAKKSPKSTKKVVTTITTTITTAITNEVAPKETHYLIIVDESGSMDHLRQVTLDGLNEQLQTIKKLDFQYPDQDYFVSIIKFDNEIVPLIQDVAAKNVKLLSLDDYKPDASTSLLDAIGISTTKLKDRIQNKLTNKEASAFVVILTDGQENSSQTEYKQPGRIKELITELENTGLWTFTFIGANQDSVLTAKNLGVNVNNTANFTASGAGTGLAFASLSSSLGKRAMYRSAGVYTNDSYLSEVLSDSNNIGENASSLDLSGTISDEDIQKAKDALNNKNNGGGSTI